MKSKSNMATGVNIGKSPNSIAVLPFYGTAALFFVLLCVLMLLSASELTGHYFAPKTLAIVHVAALGWGTMIIFGSAYQLIPVIFEKDLFSIPLAFTSYILLTIGTSLLVWSFWEFRTGTPLILAGVLLVAAIFLYFTNVFFTALPSIDENIYKIFIVVSTLWLLITAVIGLLLAINLSHTFIPRNHLDILKLHAHAGLGGWFLQLITGVSAKLVPMFLLGKSKRTWLLKIAIISQNLGLILFLADGYANPISPHMLLYAFFVSIGIISWLLYLMDTFRSRVRKKIDIPMKHTGVSFIFLVCGLLILPISFILTDTKWTAIYGTFLFLGWITAIILGKTFKTLPFIVWNDHYRLLNGKIKVPLPKNLYHDRLVTYQFYVYLTAFLSLVIGMILEELYIIQGALILWLALSLGYGYNVMKIIFHKRQTTDGNSIK